MKYIPFSYWINEVLPYSGGLCLRFVACDSQYKDNVIINIHKYAKVQWVFQICHLNGNVESFPWISDF